MIMKQEKFFNMYLNIKNYQINLKIEKLTQNYRGISVN